MITPRQKALPRLAAAGLLPLLLAASTFRPVSARQAVLQGVVTDEVSGVGIASARVTLVASGVEVRTNADGIFSFNAVPSGHLSVRAQAPGYPAVVEEITVAPDAVIFVQIRLPTVPEVLRELLVVAPAPDAAATRDARTAADLLALQIPGINANSGVVGRNNGSVLPRGASSLSLGSEPAIYLDGVLMAGGLVRAQETLSQIPASNVKAIRVLRGPASAFLHGSATGAIYIETRRGPDGGR
jgi:hypothetical protein